jgi:glycosyltransferase involved in cell wall biosynthesis
LAQNRSDVEIIVVDDGSTDSTSEKLAKYADDNRVAVIRQENQGVSAARNAALRRAIGKYVAFVDSDDLIHPRFMEICLGLMSDDDCDFVFLKWYEFEDGESLAFGSLDGSRFEAVDNPLNYYLNNGFKGAMWTMFVRRSLMEGIEFPAGIHSGEDLCFAFSLLPRLKKGKCLLDPVYFYRRSINSLDSGNLSVADVLGLVSVIKKIWELYSQSYRVGTPIVQKRLFPRIVKNCVKRGIKKSVNAQDLREMEFHIASLINGGFLRFGGFSWRWRWRLWLMCRRSKSDGRKL